jgi:predicted nuclease of predicted toxin-antitoxin system
MHFLADQDIWKVTLHLLRGWGHDVLQASEIEMARASDEALLKRASKDKRIFITRDKGFGYLVFLGDFKSPGVILLRMTTESANQVHAELRRLLEEHTEQELRVYFTTVEPRRHRIRRIAPA